MKNFRIAVVALVASVGLLFSSCSKDSESILGSLEVTVNVAESYTGVSTSNLEVTLTNTSDNSTIKATTDASGKVTFLDLAPGSYNVATSVTLSADDAFNYTGFHKELTLNATLTNIALLPKEMKQEAITLDGKAGGALVIKEIYTVGAANDGYAIMFKDQFIEIFNNSDEVQYLDGLYLANINPQRSGTNPAKEPVSTLAKNEFIYANKVLQFPGNGTDYPLQPGMGAVIALNAVNYLESKPDAISVDNSKADFDTYAIDWLQSLGRTGSAYFDIDNPDVPTMSCIYLNIDNYGWFNFDSDASVALLKLDAVPTATIQDPDLTSQVFYMKLPVAGVIDGVDILNNIDAAPYKRLPTTVDAGFFYLLENGKNNYTGMSARRKVAKTLTNGRVVLMDTNNSGNDFEAIEQATPHCYNIN